MSKKKSKRRRKATRAQPVVVIEARSEQATVAYDESLLERARTQWQFGDWESLAELNYDSLQHHPDRATLGLLAAAGRLQTGQYVEARKIIWLARDWGASNKLVSQILIAGVYNSLGRAAAICNQSQRALRHFKNAVRIGVQGGDVKLLAQARAEEQLSQLGLIQPNDNLNVGATGTPLHLRFSTESPTNGESSAFEDIHRAWQAGRWDLLARLDNAELASHSNRADMALYAACGYQQLEDLEGLQRCSRLSQEWGCPRDKLKRFLAAGIHNTLALSDALAGQYESAAKAFVVALTVDQTVPKLKIVENRVRSQLKTLQNIDIDQVFDAVVENLQETSKGKP